jgi:hypothetical protein
MSSKVADLGLIGDLETNQICWEGRLPKFEGRKKVSRCFLPPPSSPSNALLQE